MQLKILNRYQKPIATAGFCKNDNIDYFSIRRMICEFILYFRMYMNRWMRDDIFYDKLNFATCIIFICAWCCSVRWDVSALEVVIPEINEDVDTLFDSIKRFLSTLRSITDLTLHYAASNMGNKVTRQKYLAKFSKSNQIKINKIRRINLFSFSTSSQNFICITCT